MQSVLAGKLQSRRSIVAPLSIDPDFITVKVTLDATVGAQLGKYETLPTSKTQIVREFLAALLSWLKVFEVFCFSPFKLILLSSRLR